MATQAFVSELANALIDSYTERLVLRIENAANSGTPFIQAYRAIWNYISQVEFISSSEWALLKRALKTDDNDVIIAQIKSRNYYRREVALKYSFMIMKIATDRKEPGRFCIIEAKERG
jgi:hypothetical protein